MVAAARSLETMLEIIFEMSINVRDSCRSRRRHEVKKPIFSQTDNTQPR